eukprot:6491037-Amphidinium_carterae.5
MVRNHLDCSHIDPSDYYNLVDVIDSMRTTDNHSMLRRLLIKVVNREMKFLEEQRLGEPVLRKNVTGKSVIWTARWVHCGPSTESKVTE